MKKKVIMTMLTAALTLSLVGPVTTLAAETSLPEVSVTQADESSPLRADEYITYYRTYNGIRQYRI